FLNLNCFSDDMLYLGHTDYKSALTIAAQYQPNALKNILDKELSWNILNCLHKNNDFLRIACIYNPQSFEIALNSKYNLIELINDEKKEPILFLATKYQPKSLEIFLKS